MSGQVKEASVQYQVSDHSCDSADSVESRVCPPGYKQTEVGVIPTDWNICELGSLAPFIGSGKTNTNNKGEYPLFGSTGKIGTCEAPEYKGDAILVARVGANAGRLNFVTGEYGVSDNTIIVRIEKSSNVNYFKYQLINKNLNSLVFGSGQPLITGSQLKALFVPVPDVKEQTAIANALSDVDALITSLEKLIAKKRAIKTAAMQQLLTGKKRLPPFDLTHTGYKQTELGEIPADWEVKSYGQAFTFLTTASNSRSDLYEGGDLSYIHYGDIHMKWDSSVDFSIDTITRIDSSKVKNANLLKDGDLIMADASEDYDGIGKSVEVMGLGVSNAVSGLHTFLLRDVGVFVDGYRGYLHLIKSTKQSFDRLATGLKVYGLSKGNLKEVLLPVPPKEEQVLIVKVLSDVSKEIDALEQRLNKTQQIKQGMMQELLTGRTRLI